MVTTPLDPQRMFESDKRPPEHTASIRTRRGDRQRQRDQWRSGGMFLVLLLLALALVAPPVSSQVSTDITITITWTIPSRNIDGSPLNDLAGYRIYWGATIDALTNIEEIPDKDALTHTFVIPAGIWVFVVAALDTSNNVSPPSQGVILDGQRPGAPGNAACTGTYALIPGTQVAIACQPAP